MNRLKRAAAKIRTSLFKGAFIHNPVLTQAIGICPIIGLATNLSDSIALSVTVGMLLLICECMTSLLLKKVPRWIRIALYAVICSCVIYFAEPFIIPLTSKGLRVLPVYIYLLCVNALVTVRCERFACKRKLRYSMVDAFSTAVGFGAVALIVGTLRELLTYGSLFSVSGIPEIPNGSLPFIAFVILGFLAAAHKAFIMKFYPEEQTDTFSMKGCDERVAFKDPGLGKKKKAAKKAADKIDDADIIKPRYGQNETNSEERQEKENV